MLCGHLAACFAPLWLFFMVMNACGSDDLYEKPDKSHAEASKVRTPMTAEPCCWLCKHHTHTHTRTHTRTHTHTHARMHVRVCYHCRARVTTAARQMLRATVSTLALERTMCMRAWRMQTCRRHNSPILKTCTLQCSHDKRCGLQQQQQHTVGCLFACGHCVLAFC